MIVLLGYIGVCDVIYRNLLLSKNNRNSMEYYFFIFINKAPELPGDTK